MMIPVRVQQILEDVLHLSRSTIPSNIEIIQDIQIDCNFILADPTQVHQVAMNLITNAYHALEETGGTILVKLMERELASEPSLESMVKPGKYAVLSITDTGCGIETNIIDKIFEPYFTTKDISKGTGLGLAVAYGIVKEHGGGIIVQSEIGKGTTFEVYFPLLYEQPEMDSVSDKTEYYETGTERILLVDDEEPIAQLEKLMLERLGYNVTVRTSSPDALEVFRADPTAFDLVITDMTMPNLTGDQLAAELIAIRPEIQVIICTGFSYRLNQQKVNALGIKGFLMKPIVLSELAQMVRKILDEANGSNNE